jgi:hypothetical protein
MCVEDVDEFACGDMGATCEPCDTGFACGGVGCELDPDSTWTITAISGEIFGDNDGSSWDIVDGAPDPFARIFAGYDEQLEEWVYEGVTSTVDDSFVADWNETVISGVPASALLDGGIGAEMFDEDIADDDEVGSCSGVVLDSAFEGEIQNLCGDFGNFEVLVQLTAE